MNTNFAPPSEKNRSPLAWSAFLGVSWTWCIGMFLPVLLVRDFGVAGFLVFAIPNIVGAAAMGRILPDAQSSRQFVKRHGAACASFSAVTILFHVFFISWIVHWLIGPIAYGISVISLVILIVIFANERWTIITSWVVLAGSLAAFGFVAVRVPWAMQQIHFLGKARSVNLLGLAPVCLLGFSLDPYCDLTFHRVRQATSPRGGMLAFAIGFGVCFASMLLFTLWYSGLLGSFFWYVVPGPIAWAIALHMIAQSTFTIAAHIRSLAMEWSPATRLGVVFGATAEVCLLILCGLLSRWPAPEMIYRAIMGFYGLVFPAYIWICLNAPSRRALQVFAITIVAASPMFWIGFIDGKMLWLIPGVLLIIAARLFIPAGPPQGAETVDPTRFAHAPSTSEP